jgi:CheY-like chemotaxis protein
VGTEQRRGKRILIVEDSLDTAQTMTYLLRDAGHQVDFAINGYAALEIARKQRPDIMFVDIGLPDFDGVELARRLKRMPGLEHVRVIALTGRVSDDEARALQAGCEQFLRKPLDPRTMEKLIS